MPIEKVNLSHWIHFLTGNIHKNETRILACVTVLISLIALFFIVWSFHWNLAMSYEQILKDENIAEATKQSFITLNENLLEFRNWIFVGILFFMMLPIGFSFTPDYIASKKLLNKILESKGYVDVNDIRNEWINRKKSKLKDNFKKWIKKKKIK